MLDSDFDPMIIAYHVDFPFNSIGLPRQLYLRIWFNCQGNCIKKDPPVSWPLDWKWRAPLAYLRHGNCIALLGNDFSDYFEGVTDMRSLSMMQKGCCPKAISNIILGEEGTPD